MEKYVDVIMDNKENKLIPSVSSLYMLKALCALGVVILHAPLGTFTDYARLISSIAVPIFFMVTGYFLYSADVQQTCNRIKKTIRKVIPLILLLQFFYFVLNPLPSDILGNWVSYSLWLLQGYKPTGGHLWYLTALLQAMIVFGFYIRWTKGDYVWVFILIWFLGFVVEDYRPLIFGSEQSLLSKNFLLYALPSLATGYLFRKWEQKIVQYNWGRIVGIVIALAYINLFILSDITAFVSIIFRPWLYTGMIVSIFVCALKYKDWGKGSKMEYIGQYLSSNIYYWHEAFIWWFAGVLVGYDQFGAIYISIMSLVFAYIVVKIQDRFGWNVFR